MNVLLINSIINLIKLCRPRPRKVTNSEKTSTTNNLSQHKYLKLKRQMQHETENTLIATGDKQIINRDQPLRNVVNAQDYRKQKCASNVSASHSVQHQYKLVSDFDSQWHSLYHHFTTYQQHRHPPSAAGLYQGSARTEGTSHLKGSSDLPKLLTSTRLSPRVPPNQQNTASCNYYSQHPSPHINSSATSANFTIRVPVATKTHFVMIMLWTLHLIITMTAAAMITACHTACQ